MSGTQNTPAWNIILLGPQASGKGTQAKLLADAFQLKHLEMGNLLRLAAKQPTELGKQINHIIHDQGVLVPFDIAMQIYTAEVEKVPADQGIIFDGTPRRLPEIEYWDQELPKLKRSFTHVIAITLSEQETIERLSKRRICVTDSTPLILGKDIRSESDSCPKCGGKVIHREDDKPDVIKARLAEYHKMTQPVIDYYTDKGLVKLINGSQSIEQVHQDIIAALKE
ncbi:MAG: nucleoside monophosphate kinase [bacterium]